MPDLVALDLPGGSSFVDEVRRAWDAGDAVFPVDQRLPPAAKAEVLATIDPTVVVDGQGRHRRAGTPIQPGDAAVLATSGTTGRPKGVVLTLDALRASATAVHRRIGRRDDDRWLACLPLNHVGGFGVVARAVLDDVPLVVLPGFDADAVAASANDGSTLVSLVATALTRIDPALFRVILLGGSRPPADRPANCIATYGLTETGGGVVYDGVPLDGVDVRVGENGAVQVRGPMLLRTYRGAALPAWTSDGWLDTGDVGGWSATGTLQVYGRRAEMIISGGENVWPEAVERHLVEHPAIDDAAVLGVDDPTWGQRVVALVTGPSPPPFAELKAFLADRLPGFMVPKEVVVVTAIPRTSLGKIARAALPDLLHHPD